MPDLQIIVKKTFKECLERGYYDPVAFAEDFLDFSPHDGQKIWLRTESDAKERVLHCSARWGKSAIAGVKLLHQCFYQIREPQYTFDSNGRLKPYIAINIAMSLDQARIAWDNAFTYASNSPRFSRFIVDSDSSPFPVMWIANAGKGKDKLTSELWARSTAKRAKYLLGKHFAFLNYDEAAFDVDGEVIWNDVLRMRLADEAGAADFMSTPNQKNWFYELAEKGRAGPLKNPRNYTQQGAIFDNPYVDHSFIRETMKFMTDIQRQQNIYGQFSDARNIFSVQYVEQCYKDRDYYHLMGGTPDSEGLPANYDVSYTERDTGLQAKLSKSKTQAKYVIGVDLARKRDNTVIMVLRIDTEPAELVCFRMFSRTSWPYVYEQVQKAHLKYNEAPILSDSTGAGDAPTEAMGASPYNLPITGYNFAGSGREKENLIIHLQSAIQNKLIAFPFIRELYDQLVYYDWEDKKLETDALFALALAWECNLKQNGTVFYDSVSLIGTSRIRNGRHIANFPDGFNDPVLTEEDLDRIRKEALDDRLRRYNDGEDLDPRELGIPYIFGGYS